MLYIVNIKAYNITMTKLVTDNDVIAKLSSQFTKHITNSRNNKKPRLESWRRVDDMIANRKIEFADTTVHVPLGKANGFMKTWLSKIDNPLTFKYVHGELADIKKATIMNAIKEKDQNTGRWNWKDLMGKQQAGAYGRAIYFYTARSPKGNYESELSVIDAFRYHIDPRAGGDDKEKARWMGWGGVEFTRDELEAGAKEGIYDKTAISELLTGSGNATKESVEDRYVKYRYQSINSTGKPTDTVDEDVFKFHRWFETINNTRYTMLITEEGKVVQAMKLEDEWKSGLWPIWTWAPNPSPTEFWTLGELEYQLYIFIAQEASISQMIENSDKVNKPQRAVAVDRIKNLSQVKYRRDSYIEVDGDTDIRFAIQDMPVPSIQTPLAVYDKLEVIQATESGLNAGTKGMADEDKVAIYEGNMQQVGDRFGLLNKSYSEGYNAFAHLHKNGVMENLTKSMAVKIIGSDGLQIEKVTKRDIKTKVDYDILIESSNAEAQSNNIDKKNKITFLASFAGNQIVNQKVAFEYGADTAGFTDDEIKRLLDTSDYATSQIIADANDIFQKLLEKSEVDEYEGANTVFLQELIKIYWKNRSEIDANQAMRIENYIESHLPIVEQNMTRNLLGKLSEMGSVDPAQGGKANLSKLGAVEDPTMSTDSVDPTNPDMDPANLPTTTIPQG